MYELKISVSKVLGTCTGEPPIVRGEHFFVRDGDISIPAGGSICLWALQSLIPVITPKEREIAEAKDDDWMWRVNHVQCPDPKGRVIYKIERVGKVKSNAGALAEGHDPNSSDSARAKQIPIATAPEASTSALIRDIRVVVEQASGHCTSNLKPGDHFEVRSGRLYIPPGRHFCLYALQATLPLLPAKQRRLDPGDWLAEDHHVICPDPAGNVIMRIEPA